jgi:hypothetical protein
MFHLIAVAALLVLGTCAADRAATSPQQQWSGPLADGLTDEQFSRMNGGSVQRCVAYASGQDVADPEAACHCAARRWHEFTLAYADLPQSRWDEMAEPFVRAVSECMR